MLNKIKVIGIALFLTSFSIVSAQNYTNSPYTRYGVGDLQNFGFTYNKAFGGASAGLRTRNQLNYLNPASFTSQDTNSFLLQSGMTMRYSKLSNNDFETWRNNMNMNYFVIGFPIGKYLNSSVGLVPYSRVEYHFQQDDLDDDSDMLIEQYDGSGGLNEFYISLAGEIYNTVSVGASLNYLFGNISRDRETYYSNASSAYVDINENYIFSDVFYRFGLQIHPTLGEKHQPVLGFAYEASSVIDSKTNNTFTHSYNPYVTSETTVSSLEDSTYSVKFPNKITIGLGYTFDERIKVTGEFITQDWSSLKEVNNYTSIRGGVGYRHRSLTERSRSSYFEHVEFRLGGHYTDTYVTLKDIDIKDYGISFGVGLPWKNYRKVFTSTGFNITYELGWRGTKDNGLLLENYHNISFGVVLHDYWFFKPKYD